MKVYLRPITLEDGIHIVKWRNSDAVKKHCFSKKKVSMDSNAEFYKAYIETGKYKQYIVERVDEDYGVFSYPIATVYLKDIDNENNRCELCIFTSDDEEWNTESQTVAIGMLLDMAFEQYKMHKIYSYVFEDVMDEVELLKNCGFEIEARLKKEAKNIDGTFSDIIRMCIVKE